MFGAVVDLVDVKQLSVLRPHGSSFEVRMAQSSRSSSRRNDSHC